jgi:PRTRC genetic system protein B
MAASGDVRLSGTEDFMLQKAILVYAGEGRKAACATVHDVAVAENGRAMLLAGVAATVQSVAEIAKLLTRQAKTGCYLPANILMVGIDSLIWWIPPARRRVFFKSEKLGGERSAEVPNPGIVFRVSGDSEWSVFAVKGHDRPTPETPLFLAPYFNVWSNGKICTGNVTVPPCSTAETIAAWERAFFDSSFTHPNVHAPEKLVEHRGGAYGFWEKMLEGNYKRFPERVLVETGKRLSDLLDGSW